MVRKKGESIVLTSNINRHKRFLVESLIATSWRFEVNWLEVTANQLALRLVGVNVSLTHEIQIENARSNVKP